MPTTNWSSCKHEWMKRRKKSELDKRNVALAKLARIQQEPARSFSILLKGENVKVFGFLSFLVGLSLLGYALVGLILKGDSVIVMIAFIIGVILTLYGNRIANLSKENN